MYEVTKYARLIFQKFDLMEMNCKHLLKRTNNINNNILKCRKKQNILICDM